MMPILQSEKYKYLPVDDAEGSEPKSSNVEDGLLSADWQKSNRKAALWSTALLVAVSICVVVLSGVVGFTLGRVVPDHGPKDNQCSQALSTHDDGPVQLDPVTVKFESNRSFLQHPSLETEELWKTLYPEDTHGLFEYPDEKPERSGFAAFHQLHCIDALRRGYYQADDVKRALSSGQEVPEFEHEVDETHTLHCIEFLRQSIMCHADTTIQTEAVYHQGIMAFGVEYQCRNWWQLVDWVNERNRKV